MIQRSIYFYFILQYSTHFETRFESGLSARNSKNKAPTMEQRIEGGC